MFQGVWSLCQMVWCILGFYFCLCTYWGDLTSLSVLMTSMICPEWEKKLKIVSCHWLKNRDEIFQWSSCHWYLYKSGVSYFKEISSYFSSISKQVVKENIYWDTKINFFLMVLFASFWALTVCFNVLRSVVLRQSSTSKQFSQCMLSLPVFLSS